jgi:hypothetical protein
MSGSTRASNMRKCIVIILASAGLLLPMLTARNSLAGSEDAVCRERSARLQQAADRCRSRVARGEIRSCVVTVSFRGNREISIQDADSLAYLFDQRALALQQAEQAVADARNKIYQDQQIIRGMRLEKRVEDFEEWEKLSSDAQRDFRITVLSEILTMGLNKSMQGVSKVGSLNPPTANTWVRKLKEAGVDNPHLFDAIRALAKTPGKPPRAKAVNQFLEGVKRSKDIYVTGVTARNSSFREIGLTALAELLGIAVKDPQLQLALSNIKIISASAYAGTASLVALHNINRLTEMTERDLDTLKRMKDIMKNHVDELKAAKSRLASQQGCY